MMNDQLWERVLYCFIKIRSVKVTYIGCFLLDLDCLILYHTVDSGYKVSTFDHFKKKSASFRIQVALISYEKYIYFSETMNLGFYPLTRSLISRADCITEVAAGPRTTIKPEQLNMAVLTFWEMP